MEILINKEIGTRCLIKEDGQKIYDLIQPILHSDKPIILNFHGVTQFASPFFNFSIGQIIINFPDIDVDHRIEMSNLNKIGQLIMQRVKENSMKYKSDFGYGDILSKVLDDQSKENS